MKTDCFDKQQVIDLTLGCIKAFDDIYYQYNDVVYANILKMVKAQDVAADILQEVFISLWQNRHKMRTDRSVAGWLFVVSYNKSATFLKRKLRESINYVENYTNLENYQPEAVVDEELYQKQLAIIEEAVDTLTARKKEVFKLYRFEGRSKNEIASLTGISPHSVKDYLKQSNKTIREYILRKYPSGIVGIATLLYMFK